MKNILIVLIGIQFFGCVVKEKDNQQTTNNIENDSAVQAVESFYRWYLDSLYENGAINSPDVVLTKDSIYKLDGTKYLRLLKQSNFFSNNFLEGQKERVNECNEELITEKGQQQYREARFMAIESKVCDFMNYYPWIGGQGEDIEKIKIIASKIDGDKAKVVVKASQEVNVELIKENALWQINKIYIR